MNAQQRERQSGYRWTPARIALAAGIVAAGAVVIGIVGGREITALRRGAEADAAYTRLVELVRDEQAAEFNLDDLAVPRRAIVFGGPPKDGIRALTDPPTVAVTAASHLRDDDRVVGVTVAGEARAYPVRALMYHEAINDVVGGVPILVVYCPLCDSVSVADRRLDDRVLAFGVSGLLLNSNVLLFDRTDDALWSQVGLAAVSGPHAGRSLAHLPWALTTLAEWRRAHPQSTVMTFDTGDDLPYDRVPYGDYFDTDRLMFPVAWPNKALPAKARVVGVSAGGVVRAYPVAEIQQAAGGIVRDRIGGAAIRLEGDPRTGSVRVAEAPATARVVHTFWFAWAAFHPQTEIYGH